MSFFVSEAVLMQVTGNPVTGAVTAGAAVAGYQALGASANGNVGDIEIYSVDANGNRNGLWETQAGSTWTNSSTSFSRSAANVVDGSSGPGVLVSFASGTQRVSIVAPVFRQQFSPAICEGRLTLTSGTPVTTADVTAAATLRFTPYKGSRIALPWGGYWRLYEFLEQSIQTSQAPTGTMISGQKTVTGLADTSQLVHGMNVTGTSIGTSAVVASIDSPTQVTLSVNSTGSTTNTVNFFVSTGLVFDVYAVPISGTAFRIQWGNQWTSNTVRNDAMTTAGSLNGVLVNNAAINAADSNAIAAQTGRYLGTIYITSGVTLEDSVLNRYVWNYYNRCVRPMQFQDSARNWNYSLATWRQANANVAARLNAVVGFVEDVVEVNYRQVAANSVANTASIGIGRDSTTAPTAGVGCDISSVPAGAYAFGIATLRDVGHGIGRHSWNALEYSAGTGGVVCSWENQAGVGGLNGLDGWLMG
jgi:hypothetical protein